MKELNVYRFRVPSSKGTLQIEREFCSDISAYAFAIVSGADKLEKFVCLTAKWEQVTKIEIGAEDAYKTLAAWFDMRKYIDDDMLDAISAGIIMLKEAQLKMFNFIQHNTQFTVTFTAYEINQILSALLAMKSLTKNHDINRLCTALLDAFQRSLNN